MKKLLKITSLLAVVAMLLLALTGCGGKKIVGTMDDDKGKATAVATFDSKDKLKEFKITYNYKDKDEAEDDYEDIKDMFEEIGGKVKKSGKKITVTIKGKDLAKQKDVDLDELDREYMEDAIESMGYEIKD